MRKMLSWVIPIVFIASFIYERHLELTHKADSIGVWYTLYCAISYTVGIVIVVIIIAWVIRLIRRKSADGL